VRRALFLLLLLLALLDAAVSAQPQLPGYLATGFYDSSVTTVGNHVVLWNANATLRSALPGYRVFLNVSGVLIAPQQTLSMNGYYVLRSVNPALLGGGVWLLYAPWAANSTLAPLQGVSAGYSLTVSSGVSVYTSGGYTCYSQPSTVRGYAYVPVATPATAALYIYAYLLNSTSGSGVRIEAVAAPFSYVSSTNAGMEVYSDFSYVVISTGSSSYLYSTGKSIASSNLFIVLKNPGTSFQLYNGTSLFYSYSGSAALASKSYYPQLYLYQAAACIGLLAAATSPVPLFIYSYTPAALDLSQYTGVRAASSSTPAFNATVGSATYSLVYFIAVRRPGAVNLTLTAPPGSFSLLDDSLSTVLSVDTGGGAFVAWGDFSYVKVGSQLYYVKPLSAGSAVALQPPSNPSSITFTIQDFGAGYQALLAYDQQGRLAASAPITALGQAALNLTPYASYVLQVCKPGLCKAVGLVTISSSNIQLTVMPSIPAVKPPSWVSASYDYANKQLVVNVSCASPPCAVSVRKVLANGTQVGFAQLACNAQLCGYALSAEDPFFLVTAQDASGKTAQASTGLSVPLWQSPLGSIVNTLGKTLNLDAFGVNVNDLVIVLVGLAAIYLGFTFRNWELAVLAFGIWLTLGTLLLGGSGSLVLPGLSLALVGAALSYMLRREQQP